MVRIKSTLNILSTLVAILALAPVLPYLDKVIIIVACMGVLAGFWCDRQERYPLHGWAATVVAIVAMLFFAVQITWADVATPLTKALIALLVVRLLTPKESRDYLQIFVLSLFILAASSLVSLDLGLSFDFLLYLILMVFAVTTGLVLLTVFVTDKRLALPRQDFFKLFKVSLIMPVVALLLMVVFFFVLPRTRHPMWNFLNPKGTAVAGLAESVEPGNYARISAIKSLVFRADMEQLAPEDLYWRALVLNQPEENRWVRQPPPAENSIPVKGTRTVSLRVFSEPRSDRYLVTLDRPVDVSGIRKEQTPDYVFIARSNLDRPYRHEQISQPGVDLQVRGVINREFYLRLPEKISPRMHQIAESIKSSQSEIRERLAALERFFLSQQLIYAQDDLSGGNNPIDNFLFDKKRGYCEFFASAYVTLARLAGVPARLVGGYLGGEYNSFGGYYQVTEDMAHVWVEVLNEDNRWIRIDPSQWAINAATTISGLRSSSTGSVTQFMDALNYRWVQGVLLFDFFQQINLLRDARDTFRQLRSPKMNVKHAYWLAGIIALAAVAYGCRRAKRMSPEARLLQELRTRLRKRYGDDMVSEAIGLQELGERLDNEECRTFARIYQGAVFKDRALNADEERQLKELLKKI